MTAVTPYYRQNVATPYSRTRMRVLDIAPLSNAAQALGLYFVGAPFVPADRWNGAAILKSVDAVSWVSGVTAISQRSVMGTSTTALPNSTCGHQIDGTGSVTVQLINSNDTLSSVTADQLIAGSNYCMIGGEILQFKTATLLSASLYELSGFIRGLQGTNRLMSSHVAGEDFLLLETAAIADVSMVATSLGATTYYGAVTFGGRITDIVPNGNTFAGNRAKPFGGSQARAYKETDNDIVINWIRRARLNNYWADFSDVPLDETTESYRVDIMDGVTVKRAITSVTPTVTYTSAQQTTDWGAPVSSIVANIYQLSSVVGAGWPTNLVWP